MEGDGKSAERACGMRSHAPSRSLLPLFPPRLRLAPAASMLLLPRGAMDGQSSPLQPRRSAGREAVRSSAARALRSLRSSAGAAIGGMGGIGGEPAAPDGESGGVTHRRGNDGRVLGLSRGRDLGEDGQVLDVLACSGGAESRQPCSCESPVTRSAWSFSTLAFEDDVLVDIQAGHDLGAVLPPPFCSIRPDVLQRNAALLHRDAEQRPAGTDGSERQRGGVK